MAEYIESEALQKQIAEIKRSIQSENREFLTGYISALSVVEGIIAALPVIKVGKNVSSRRFLLLSGKNVTQERRCEYDRNRNIDSSDYALR